jgi:SAM-dependent methyltransferase
MVTKIFSKKQFFDYLNSDEIKMNLEKDKILSDKILNYGLEEKIPGFCQVCNKESFFLVDSRHSYDNIVRFRERMVCESCGLNNRQRFLIGQILKMKKIYENCKVFIYEQVTPFYKSFVKYIPNTVGSEYLDYKYESGTIINGIQHEDSSCLSFSDNSFDLILSLDVFEHVFDLGKSFSEAFRVLKPSGQLIFSIPFHMGMEITEKRAELENGNIVFYKPPQYHSNPVSDKGSLVVYDIAWDCLEMLKNVGFIDAYMIAGYNRKMGNIGSVQFFFVAKKI